MRLLLRKIRYIFGICLLLSLSLPCHAKQTILVLGDSLSAGYGIDANKGWVSIIQKDFAAKNWHTLNASVSGETTTGGKKRLEKLLLEHNPSIVIIELGGNDGLRGQSLQIMRANLQTMIDLTKTKNITTILVGIQIPPNYGTRYAQDFYKTYHELAMENQLIEVPFLLEGVATQANLMQADAIHPNELAQPIIANLMKPYIEKAIKQATQKFKN